MREQRRPNKIQQAYERGVAAGRDEARGELLELLRAIGAKAHEIEGLITSHFYGGQAATESRDG